MTLSASGPISFGQIAQELGKANSNVSASSFYKSNWGGQNLEGNSKYHLGLVNVPASGCISMSGLRGRTGRFKVYALGGTGNWTWGVTAHIGMVKNESYTCYLEKSCYLAPTWCRWATSGCYTWTGIKSDGTLWGWGQNSFGILGTNNQVAYSSPIQISASVWCSVKLSGGNQMFGIRSDGTLWAWGQNLGNLGTNNQIAYSSPVQVAGAWSTGKWAVSGPGFPSYGIKSDGTLWGWGTINCWGYGTVASPLIARSSPIQVSASAFCHSGNNGFGGHFAITTAGTLYAWGCGVNGQLGTSDTLMRCPALSYAHGGTYREMFTSSAYYGLHAIKTDGSLWAWGRGDCGANGIGTTIARSSPVQISASAHCCLNCQHCYWMVATRTDGTAWQWGGHVACGPNVTNSCVPTQIPLGLGGTGCVYRDVHVGSNSFFGQDAKLTDSSGCVWWYANCYYGMPINSAPYDPIARTPTLLDGIALCAKDVSSGLYIDNSCNAYMYGIDGNAYFGLNSTLRIKASDPVQLGTLGWKQLQRAAIVPYRLTLGIRTDGTLWSWGADFCGGTGLGTTITRSSPTQISAATDWCLVRVEHAGGINGAAINTSNQLFVWGANTDGRLGLNDSINRSSPVQVPGSWCEIVFAQGSTLAIRTDCTLWSWGYGLNYANYRGETVNRSSPVQIAGTWCALASLGYPTVFGWKTDGTVWVAGSGMCGVAGLGMINNACLSSPVQLTGSWCSISSGTGYAAYGIKSDGTLWGWGNIRGIPCTGTICPNVYRCSPIQLDSATDWLGFINPPQLTGDGITLIKSSR